MAQSADRQANSELRARFDDVFQQYRRLRSGMDELQAKLAELRVTATSDDGHVTATVGPRGQLVSLELDPRVYRHDDARALAAKITATVQQAAASATTAVQKLVSGYLPAGSGAVDFIKDGDFGSLLRRSDAALDEETPR